MAPFQIPKAKKPSSQEIIELTSGPRVEIFVGQQKKRYSLPKKLLCYYSDYFERCFNGKFMESHTQKLTLDEDKAEHFDVLVQYMLSGGEMRNDVVTITETGEPGLKECMEFIEYADKYGLGDAGSAVHDSLESILPGTGYLLWDGGRAGASIEPSHVETVFKATLAGNPLRALIAKAALATDGMRGQKFAALEREIEGFAVEMLALIKEELPVGNWVDPLSGTVRND